MIEMISLIIHKIFNVFINTVLFSLSTRIAHLDLKYELPAFKKICK